MSILQKIFGSKHSEKHRKNEEELLEWVRNGKPVPPPHIVKQQAIDYYRTSHSISRFIETGTFMGDMVEAQRKKFKSITSIELDRTLHQKAVERFKKYSHIQILQGDSGEVLAELCKKITGPCLFWLDGHYSAGITAKGELNTPIIKELQSIFSTPFDHVILIDDARLFVGQEDYPTVEELEKFVKSCSSYKTEVKDDIIRLWK